MGFLNGLFKGKEEKPIELPISEAGSFLEKQLAPKRKQALEHVAGSLAEIKHGLRQVEASLKELKSAQPPEGSERLQRIVKTSKRNTLTQMASLIEKLQPPNTEDLASIRKYCLESIALLQQSNQFGKNIAYTGISFKGEVKQLGAQVKQLNQAFVSLRDLLDDSHPVFLAETISLKLSELEKQKKAAETWEADLGRMHKGLERMQQELSKQKSSMHRLKESEEFKSIEKLNEQKAGLLKQKQSAKTDLLDLFAKVEKPLHRLSKAGNARKASLSNEQASFLQQLLINPFVALKRDPKADTIKSIMLLAKQSIESGVIELKEKEKQKKISTLQELISFNFFEESFWKFNKIDSQLLAIEKQLQELPAIKKEQSLDDSIKQLHASLQGLDEEIKRKKDASNSLAVSIQKNQDSIEPLLGRATGKRVSLKS